MGSGHVNATSVVPFPPTSRACDYPAGQPPHCAHTCSTTLRRSSTVVMLPACKLDEAVPLFRPQRPKRGVGEGDHVAQASLVSASTPLFLAPCHRVCGDDACERCDAACELPQGDDPASMLSEAEFAPDAKASAGDDLLCSFVESESSFLQVYVPAVCHRAGGMRSSSTATSLVNPKPRLTTITTTWFEDNGDAKATPLTPGLSFNLGAVPSVNVPNGAADRAFLKLPSFHLPAERLQSSSAAQKASGPSANTAFTVPQIATFHRYASLVANGHGSGPSTVTANSIITATAARRHEVNASRGRTAALVPLAMGGVDRPAAAAATGVCATVPTPMTAENRYRSHDRAAAGSSAAVDVGGRSGSSNTTTSTTTKNNSNSNGNNACDANTPSGAAVREDKVSGASSNSPLTKELSTVTRASTKGKSAGEAFPSVAEEGVSTDGVESRGTSSPGLLSPAVGFVDFVAYETVRSYCSSPDELRRAHTALHSSTATWAMLCSSVTPFLMRRPSGDPRRRSSVIPDSLHTCPSARINAGRRHTGVPSSVTGVFTANEGDQWSSVKNSWNATGEGEGEKELVTVAFPPM